MLSLSTASAPPCAVILAVTATLLFAPCASSQAASVPRQAPSAEQPAAQIADTGVESGSTTIAAHIGAESSQVNVQAIRDGSATLEALVCALEERATKRDRFVLEAGTHKVRQLIDDSAVFLGRNYICADVSLQGSPTTEVTLQNRMELDEDGCERVVGQLLYSIGLAIAPLEPEFGVYEVISLQGPRRGEVLSRPVGMSPREVIRQRGKKIVVQCAVQLKHVTAQTAVNSLRPFFHGSGQPVAVQVASVGSSILISGFADTVAVAIETLLRVDDASGPEQEVNPDEPPTPTMQLQLDTILQKLRGLERRIIEVEKRVKDND